MSNSRAVSANLFHNFIYASRTDRSGFVDLGRRRTGRGNPHSAGDWQRRLRSSPLVNPPNDAKLLGDTLTQLGFQVISRRDADQATMKRALQEFGAKLEKAGPDSVGLFYMRAMGYSSTAATI